MNIRRVAGTKWKGQRTEQTDKSFVQFESLEWGIRAAFCILDTYRRKYQDVCVEDIINRWAPPSENATSEYIRTVCRLTGFGGKETLVCAMAFVECGAHISKETINKAHSLYVKLKSNSK